MQNIIYVMRHFDIGNKVDIPYKKVGITGAGNATLDSRLQQLSSTKSPIKIQCVAAWEYRDARVIEQALHSLLEDVNVEGEWFLDVEDNLVERLRPIMRLIGATELDIKQSDDVYTKDLLEREADSSKKAEHALLGEVFELLESPMRSSSRKGGPTFYSDSKQLTYYVKARKSGRHHLSIGRTKKIYDDIKVFLEEQGFAVAPSANGNAQVMGVSVKTIAAIINLVEREFVPE